MQLDQIVPFMIILMLLFASVAVASIINSQNTDNFKVQVIETELCLDYRLCDL